MLKNIIFAIFCLSNALVASAPGTPLDRDEVSQFVVIGKPSVVSCKYYYKGKEYSLKEVKEFYKDLNDSIDTTKAKAEEYPRFQIEYSVMIDPVEVVKGAIVAKKLEFKWKDLYDSMCPHIPKRALTKKGIWYLGSRVKEHEHDHAVYWIDFSENNLQAIVGKDTDKLQLHNKQK